MVRSLVGKDLVDGLGGQDKSGTLWAGPMRSGVLRSHCKAHFFLLGHVHGSDYHPPWNRV